MSNFFNKTLPLFFVLLTMMTACDNASKQTPPSVSATKQGFYKHLKGTVGDYSVTMDLVKNVLATDKYTAESWEGYSGFYYYDKYQEPISLYGSVDSTGTLVIEEWAAEGGAAQFRGHLTPEGAFIGTWQDSAKTKTLNVVLKETYADGAIGLENKEFADSFRLFEKLKNSPVASFGMDVLFPAKNTEGGVSNFLKNEFFSNMRYETGEEVSEKPLPKKNYDNVSLTDLQHAQRDSFFTAYKESMKDEKPDSSADNFSLSHSRSSKMQVVFNEKDLLSVAYTSSAYNGGAHGSYGTDRKSTRLNSSHGGISRMPSSA